MVGLIINLCTTGAIISMICDGQYQKAVVYYCVLIAFCLFVFASTIMKNKSFLAKWKAHPFRVIKIMLFYSIFWPYWFLEATYNKSL